MLSQILKEFHNSGGVISLNELSQRIGVARSALDGMLQTLARQGRLREVCATGRFSGSCHCSSCHGCVQAHGDGPDGKLYELVSPR
jgi:DNA-binding IclR family transcriptional regulator